ncbi:MAG: universal stress protein [Bdellovibrionales bacterium]
MSGRVFLVVVDESLEFQIAMQYAAERARAVGGRVAFLGVVEQQGIETWSGVERALDDEAFDRVRAVVAAHEKTVEAITGFKPLTYYYKGETRSVLIELIDEEPDVSTLVLAAQTGENAHNTLIQYLTSDKGIRKLKIPLIIVPDTCRCLETAQE